MNSRNFSIRLAAVILVALFAFSAFAQVEAPKPSSDELALKVGQAQEANRGGIAQYSWRVKSTITKGGEKMATRLVEMRINSDNKVESTKISEESYVKSLPGLRGRRQRKEMEQFSGYLEQVMDQSFNYILMSKGTLVDMFEKAEITQKPDTLIVAGKNLFVDQDQLNLSIDPATNLSRTLTFTTIVGDDQVNGVVDYTAIEGGPVRPSKFTIDIPAQTIQIVAETFDWIKQQ